MAPISFFGCLLIIEAGTFNGNIVTALDKTYVTFGNKATYKGTGWSK